MEATTQKRALHRLEQKYPVPWSLTQQLAAIKRAATKEILFPMIRFVVILICSPIHIDHLRLPRRGLRKPSSTSLRGGTGSVNIGTVEFL